MVVVPESRTHLVAVAEQAWDALEDCSAGGLEQAQHRIREDVPNLFSPGVPVGGAVVFVCVGGWELTGPGSNPAGAAGGGAACAAMLRGCRKPKTGGEETPELPCWRPPGQTSRNVGCDNVQPGPWPGPCGPGFVWWTPRSPVYRNHNLCVCVLFDGTLPAHAMCMHFFSHCLEFVVQPGLR